MQWQAPQFCCEPGWQSRYLTELQSPTTLSSLSSCNKVALSWRYLQDLTRKLLSGQRMLLLINTRTHIVFLSLLRSSTDHPALFLGWPLDLKKTFSIYSMLFYHKDPGDWAVFCWSISSFRRIVVVDDTVLLERLLFAFKIGKQSNKTKNVLMIMW